MDILHDVRGRDVHAIVRPDEVERIAERRINFLVGDCR
jgi:hypothetical protein